eukprot:TRINITY_DN37072_c0_g1_i1.p1 TRINITY_DN37072_c0_g1~~TRINITY_DN37072_c0_g1_i1.p1  ORF type:complete len:298 (+),score=46.65 TRINITY_DN37072_c0_g1_i1:86-979(+)
MDSTPRRPTAHVVPTPHGPVHVEVEGAEDLPTLVTYHGIGLNHASTFRSFLTHLGPSCVVNTRFRHVHIDSPGHEEGSGDLATTYNMDQLVEQIESVLDHLTIKAFVGIGVGVGSYVLALFAATHPHRVLGLLLIGGTSRAPCWSEWISNTILTWTLAYAGMTSWAERTFLSRWFSPSTHESQPDLVAFYRAELRKRHAVNVMKLLEAYGSRSDIGKQLGKVRCKTLVFVGGMDPMQSDTMELFAQFDSTIATWVKVDGCSLLLHIENPSALRLPINLFFQGLGYIIPTQTVHPEAK